MKSRTEPDQKAPDTKEKILQTALRLFAKNGYQAVSVSMISEALRITKGALYRHYQNKQDIFDNIVERMIQINRSRAKIDSLRESAFEEEAPENKKKAELERLGQFALAEFDFWTLDAFAANFRKMLALEQYQNPEMNALYQNCLVSGPVNDLEELFRKMMNRDILKKTDAKALAVEFYAPFFLLLNMSDSLENQLSEAREKLEAHMGRFIDKL